jgi:hypothetical protein
LSIDGHIHVNYVGHSSAGTRAWPVFLSCAYVCNLAVGKLFSLDKYQLSRAAAGRFG